jgi:hypothetical protein
MGDEAVPLFILKGLHEHHPSQVSVTSVLAQEIANFRIFLRGTDHKSPVAVLNPAEIAVIASCGWVLSIL